MVPCLGLDGPLDSPLPPRALRLPPRGTPSCPMRYHSHGHQGYIHSCSTWASVTRLGQRKRKAMRVTSELQEQNGRWDFYFEYKPTHPNFEKFLRWCMEPLQGPCWKAIARTVVPNIVLLTEGRAVMQLTDRGAGIARISGGLSVKSVFKELSKLYPQTPFQPYENV